MKKNQYDCSKCPGYCCTYDHIEVSQHDIKRLAKHLDITPAAVDHVRSLEKELAALKGRLVSSQGDELLGAAVDAERQRKRQ